MNLEELSARAEIHDVLLRYCRGLDRVDMDLVRGAFHPDAWVDFPASLHVGSVDGFVDFLTGEMPRFVRTMHLLGNSLVEFDGPNIAHVETYLNADHQGTEVHQWANENVKLWARYLDRFERRGGEWRIIHRLVMWDWYRHFKDSADLDKAVFGNGPVRMSGKWPDDPLYALFDSA